MSGFVVSYMLQLAAGLIGAGTYFLVAGNFFLDHRKDRDTAALDLSAGFALLGLWQLFALLGFTGGIMGTIHPLLNLAGLAAVLLGFILTIHPFKGGHDIVPAAVLVPISVIGPFRVVSLFLYLLVIGLLGWLHFKRHDRPALWLAGGFAAIFLSFLDSFFFGGVFLGLPGFVVYLLQLAGFGLIFFWFWRCLAASGRKRLIFRRIAVGVGATTALVLIFSLFFIQLSYSRLKNEVAADARLAGFYVETLKSISLTASQVIARNDDLVSLVKARKLDELTKISSTLMLQAGQQFLIVADKKGEVVMKLGLPPGPRDNILTERIGAESIEGRPAATVEKTAGEGLSIRGASPIFDSGKIIGVVITGFVMDDLFTAGVGRLTGIDVSVYSEDAIKASTIAGYGGFSDPLLKKNIESIAKSGEALAVGNFGTGNIIGGFTPLGSFGGSMTAVLIVSVPLDAAVGDNQAVIGLVLLLTAIVTAVASFFTVKFDSLKPVTDGS
jgi:hypothetical protein